MKKIIILFLTLFLFAQDSDMDGVDDKFDKCPNTPFLALVDKNGCQIKKIYTTTFTIYTGYSNIDIKNSYPVYFGGLKLKYNHNIFEVYYSKLKYKQYKSYSNHITIGYKKNNYLVKLKQYFTTYYNRHPYTSIIGGYQSILTFTYEHKFKKAKYNDCITVLKKFNYKNLKIGFYNYNYVNTNYNFIGSYMSYYIDETLFFTFDYYKNTNKYKQTSITFMLNKKF